MNALVVDDNINDFYIIHKAFGKKANLYWLSNVLDANLLIDTKLIKFTLVLCDIHGVDFNMGTVVPEVDHRNVMYMSSLSKYKEALGDNFIDKGELVPWIRNLCGDRKRRMADVV
jgi:hypothetical protein